MGQIELQNVIKSFGEVNVIKDISLDIKEGEFVVFVGPSGCGKSTLLRMISGLETLTSGGISIANRDVTHAAPADRKIAMVFQSYALFPHISVRDNVGFGLKIAGLPQAEIDQKVNAAADILGLQKLLDRKPRELSGGQQQRVAIGRAIVREPAVFLFDEPLSNLDAALRVQMRIELIKLHASLDATMIYVTHDQVEAMTMADRIVVLRDGVVEQFDTPVELYDHPANEFVAGFIGSPKMNFVPAAPDKGGKVKIAGKVSQKFVGLSDKDLTAKMKVGIRPEHITYSHDKGDWRGVVSVAEQLGSDAYLYVDVEGIGPITVRAVGERTFNRDDEIYLTFDPERCHLFDGDGQRIN
ncbi:MAG: sn-glycerol-3-phosphate ABC transporter ATP-binding protein UgpC [Pseudomonadota bacterium]